MKSADQLSVAFIGAARQRLASSLQMIEHCLAQLPDDDLYWRPFETQNSLCNIVLHLCGNLRQWIISGVGGVPDVRDRPAEFVERAHIPRQELLERLRGVVAEADAVLAAVPPDALSSRRRVQGFETTVLAAIFDTVAHVEGHAQEVTYIARLRLEDRYRFRWVPTSAEQGAPVE